MSIALYRSAKCVKSCCWIPGSMLVRKKKHDRITTIARKDENYFRKINKMIKKLQANISSFIANHRLALWALLLVLSGTILVFPVSIRYVYAPIESASIFGENILLFGIIYCVWSLLLFLLLFTNNKNSDWQRLALLCVFSIVFLGFWAIKTPYGGQWDEVWNLGHVQYLVDTGKIVLGNVNLTYFQFPAFHLDIYALSQFTGTGLFATRIAYLLLSSILFSSVLYMLFSRILKDSWLASLAVILMLQGTLLATWEVFWPGNLAFLFLTILLALVCRREDKPTLGVDSQTGWLVMFIIFAAFVISYLPLPLYFIFIVLGVYLLQRIARKGIVRLPLIMLFTLLFAVWIIYWASSFFESLTSFIPTFLQALSDPFSNFTTISTATKGYVGTNIPLWATLIRYYWMALIFGVGGILTAWNLVRARKLSKVAVIETGGLLGVIAFTAVIYIVIPIAEWTRVLVMVPLFAIPVIIGSIVGYNHRNELMPKRMPHILEWLTKHVLTLLVIACFLLSLPTFLAHQTSYTTLAIYPYDLSTGEYLESTYGVGNGLNIYSSYAAITYIYYVPEAQYHLTDAPELFVRGNELWQKLDQLESDFNNSHDPNALFIVTERFTGPSGYPTEIKPNDPDWLSFISSLETHNRIYIDGHSEIYGY